MDKKYFCFPKKIIYLLVLFFTAILSFYYIYHIVSRSAIKTQATSKNSYKIPTIKSKFSSPLDRSSNYQLFKNKLTKEKVNKILNNKETNKDDKDKCYNQYYNESFINNKENAYNYFIGKTHSPDICLTYIHDYTGVIKPQLNQIAQTIISNIMLISQPSLNRITSTFSLIELMNNNPKIEVRWFMTNYPDLMFGHATFGYFDNNNDRQFDNVNDSFFVDFIITGSSDLTNLSNINSLPILNQDLISNPNGSFILTNLFHEVLHSVRGFERFKANQDPTILPEDEEYYVDYYGNLVRYFLEMAGYPTETIDQKLTSSGINLPLTAYKFDQINYSPDINKENFQLYQYLYDFGLSFGKKNLINWIEEEEVRLERKYGQHYELINSQDKQDSYKAISSLESNWIGFWNDSLHKEKFLPIIKDMFSRYMLTPYFFEVKPYSVFLSSFSTTTKSSCYEYQNSSRCFQSCKGIDYQCTSYPPTACCYLPALLPISQ